MEWAEIPPSIGESVRFVDSHLHLDSPDSKSVVSFASKACLTLLACGIDRNTSLSTLKMAAERPGVVKPFVGVHPSEARKSRRLDWLDAALKGAEGVGEIGLDPTYSSVGPRGAQMTVFREQLEAASRRSMPVQVHSRRAEKGCLETLGGYGVRRVLMHWLGDEHALPAAMEKGYFVSFGPALLFSKELQRMAMGADRDHVLAESDSPVAFAPLGGVRGPSLIPSVVFMLAQLWRVPFEEAASTLSANSAVFLGWKG